jgi:hypothetical protein
VKALIGKRGVRVAYDRGDLEIRSVQLQLDDGSWLLNELVYILTEECRCPIHASGAIALRRKRLQRGIQPESCFWFATAHHLAGVRRLDLRIHPPPELVLEVDVARSKLNRHAMYAAFGVREVWRLEETSLHFYTLTDEQSYVETETSLAFPFLAATDLPPVLEACVAAGDQHSVFKTFRAWVRQRVAAATPPSPPPPTTP